MSKKTPSRAAYMRTYRAKQKAMKELPDYGIDPNSPKTPAGDGTQDLASDLPITTNSLALNIAEWDDVVSRVQVDGYQMIRNSAPVVETIEKLAKRTAKLNWVVKGEGLRAEAIAEIFNQSIGLLDAIVWLTWAKIEGFRVMQIKSAPGREGSEPWIIPDFYMGGRMKEFAGGEMAWDGRRLVQILSQETGIHRQASEMPIEQFIIHRPGAGSNPEGDSIIGVATYNLAKKWEDAMRSIDAHAELYSVPIRVLKANMDGVRPDRQQGLLQDKANQMRRLKQNQEMILTDKDMITLLEPKGNGFKDMVSYAQYLEGMIDQLFLGNTLTSKTNEGGRTGNTMVHADEQDDDVLCNAIQLAESFNRHLIPWIINRNPNLPPLEEGQFEPFLWPTPPHEDEDLSVEAEEVDGMSGHEDEEEEGSGHETGQFTLLREGKWLPHTVTLDEDGNGTSSSTQDHVHEVVDGVVEEVLNHTHKLEKVEADEPDQEPEDEPDAPPSEDDDTADERAEDQERAFHPEDAFEVEAAAHPEEDADFHPEDAFDVEEADFHPEDAFDIKDEDVIVEGNPFSIVSRGGKFLVIKTSDGEVMGTHDTLDAAQAQLAALEINVDD